MTDDWRAIVIERLSSARMSPYMERCGGNRKEALNLYIWHAGLTAAVQTVLGITEVVLRNAIDCQLQIWNRNHIPGASSWLLQEPAAPLRSLTSLKRRDALCRAINQASSRSTNHRRYGQVVTHDDVLSQIMFGMWRDLLPNHLPGANPELAQNVNRTRLWNEALRNAFPHIEDEDGAITFWRVAHLHRLRNRVSHVEPLLDVNVKHQIQEAFDLVASIDPAIADWLTGVSRVGAELAKKPR
ncbi:hypothetical protein [Schaalia turicensis]|uniref:hypothetical protein n=1 Tax=Schaalia turicensis TaxID=131111 RepID=UPI0036BF8C2A